MSSVLLTRITPSLFFDLSWWIQNRTLVTKEETIGRPSKPPLEHVRGFTPLSTPDNRVYLHVWGLYELPSRAQLEHSPETLPRQKYDKMSDRGTLHVFT